MDAMQRIRKMFPSLRRKDSVAIIHSGCKQTVYGCLCGAVHTCATRHRNAKHVERFIDAHCECADKLLSAPGPLQLWKTGYQWRNIIIVHS